MYARALRGLCPLSQTKTNTFRHTDTQTQKGGTALETYVAPALVVVPVAWSLVQQAVLTLLFALRAPCPALQWLPVP